MLAAAALLVASGDRAAPAPRPPPPRRVPPRGCGHPPAHGMGPPNPTRGGLLRGCSRRCPPCRAPPGAGAGGGAGGLGQPPAAGGGGSGAAAAAELLHGGLHLGEAGREPPQLLLQGAEILVQIVQRPRERPDPASGGEGGTEGSGTPGDTRRSQGPRRPRCPLTSRSRAARSGGRRAAGSSAGR